MSEKLLQFIWQNKLFGDVQQYTSEGKPVEIILPGLLNADAGPDFFDARIKIEHITWVGNIEIHLKSSDWYRHGHQNDQAYENTILHVVLEIDKEIVLGNRKLPQLQLNFPDYLLQNYRNLMSSSKWIACQDDIKQISAFELNVWIDRMMIERLELKTERFKDFFSQTNSDWTETFYRLLAINFGFKVNSLPFELLAKSLPYKILGRHRNQLIQLEALLFGQAGMLSPIENADEYYVRLLDEYQFLQKKYQLIPIKTTMWKWSKMRPMNFPSIRIAQFAKLIHTSENLFSKLLEINSLDEIHKLFKVTINSDYWLNHYLFNKESKVKPKSLGSSSLSLILINTVIPILFFYGKTNQNEKMTNRAIQFLSNIAPEDNKIIRAFDALNLSINNAGESQAYIHLYNHYCLQKKCASCFIGQKLISKMN